MKLSTYFTFVLTLFTFAIPAETLKEEFERNSHFSREERDRVRPYLMPEDHPILPALNKIFRASRASLDEKSFKAAGFEIKCSKERSYIIVASHPKIPGYLVKLHLDSEKQMKRDRPGWKWFIDRIIGADKILDCIAKFNIVHFTAPKKWIYPLPEKPSVPKLTRYQRKNVILVVEDMQLVSEEMNEKAWKNKITKNHLDEFLIIATEAGGGSYRPDNVCYNKEGKFAFIDTEYPFAEPTLTHITPFLSPEMADYWMSKLNPN